MKLSIILICFHIIQLSKSEDHHQHLTEKFHSDKVIRQEPCHDYNTLKYSAPIHAINIEEDPELDHTAHPPEVETNDEVQIDGIETHSSPHSPESHPSLDDEDTSIIEHPIDQAKEKGTFPSESTELHAGSTDYGSGTPSPPSQPSPGPSKGGNDFHSSQPIDPLVGASQNGAAFYPGHPIPYYPHSAGAGSTGYVSGTPSPPSQLNPGPSKGGKDSHPSQPIDPLVGASEHGSAFYPGPPIPYYPHPAGAGSTDYVSGTSSLPSQSNPGPSKGGKDFRPSQPIDPRVGASEHGSTFYPSHPIPYYPHPAVYGSGYGIHPYYVGGSSFGPSGYRRSFSSSHPVSPVYPSPEFHAGGSGFDSSKGSGSTPGASKSQPIFPVYPSGYYSGGHASHSFQTSGSDYDKSFSNHQRGGNSYYFSKGDGSASGSPHNGKPFSSSQPISPVYPSTGYYVGRHGFLPFEASGSASGPSHQPVSPIYPPPVFYPGGNGPHPGHGIPLALGASGNEKPFPSSQPVAPVYPSQRGHSNAFYPTHASVSSSGASEAGKSFSAPHPIPPTYPSPAQPTDGKAIHSYYSTGGSNYGQSNYAAYPQLAIYPHPGVIYKPVSQPAPPKEPAASPNQHKVQYDSYGHEIKFGAPFYPGYSSYAPSFHFFQPPLFTPGPRYPLPPKNGPGFKPSLYQPKDQAPYPGVPYPPKPELGFHTLPYPPIYGYSYVPQAPKNVPGPQSQPQLPKQTPSFRPPQSKPAPPSYNYGGQSNEKGYEYQYFQPGQGYTYQHRTQYNYNAPQLPVDLQQGGLGKSNGLQTQNTKAVEGFQRAFYPGPYYNTHYPPYFQRQPKTFVYYIFVEDVKPVVEYNDHHHPELPARLRLPKDQVDAEDRSQGKSKRKDLHEPELTIADVTDIPPEQLKVKPHPKPLTPEQIKHIIELAHSKAMEHHVKDSELPPAVSTQFFSRIYPSPKNATHMEMQEETFDK